MAKISNINFLNGGHNRWNLAVYSNETLSVVRILSNDENEHYPKAVDAISSFVHAHWPFRVLELNYLELESFARKTATMFAEGKIQTYTDDLHVQMNRRIMNFLASAGSFLAFTLRRHKRFARKAKTGSEFFALVEKAKFDNFELRFVLELRNYAAHYSLPLGGLQFTGTTAPDGEKVHRMVASFRRDDLLEDDRWDPVLRKEIELFGPEFDALPILFVALRELSKLDDQAIKYLLPAVVPDAEFILRLNAEVAGGEAYVVKPTPTKLEPPRAMRIAINPLFPERARDILALANSGESS